MLQKAFQLITWQGNRRCTTAIYILIADSLFEQINIDNQVIFEDESGPRSILYAAIFASVLNSAKKETTLK